MKTMIWVRRVSGIWFRVEQALLWLIGIGALIVAVGMLTTTWEPPRLISPYVVLGFLAIQAALKLEKPE